MKSPIHNCINIIATGFVVLVLMSLPFFWARWSCKMFLNNSYSKYHGLSLGLSKCGFLPPDLLRKPAYYEGYDFSAKAELKPGEMSFLGISEYLEATKSGGYLSNISYRDKYNKFENKWDRNNKKELEKTWVYFDKKTNQIICQYTVRENLPGIMSKVDKLYAGPEGISDTADKKLGHFFSPVINLGKWDWRQPLTIYEQKSRRFFKINFAERTVIQGSQLSKDDPHKPIKIGLERKNPSLLELECNPANIKISRQEAEKRDDFYTIREEYFLRSLDYNYGYTTGQYLPVIDKTGRIDLLDREKLEFDRIAGHLPAPPSFFPQRKFVTPKDLLAYEIFPLALDTDYKYRGMFVENMERPAPDCKGRHKSIKLMRHGGA